MPRKDDRRLRVGVLGCGPIAQAAHFESAAKARNAELYAICDVAADLRARMAATWAPQKSFADYAEMLTVRIMSSLATRAATWPASTLSRTAISTRAPMMSGVLRTA